MKKIRLSTPRSRLDRIYMSGLPYLWAEIRPGEHVNVHLPAALTMKVHDAILSVLPDMLRAALKADRGIRAIGKMSISLALTPDYKRRDLPSRSELLKAVNGGEDG